MNIAVLLTCHNRREKTLACLQAIMSSVISEKIRLHVFLVDDGSTDGTSSEVARLFPEVEILRSDGSLFWNRGMHMAFDRALRRGFDFYLWINDDTYIYQNSITRLLTTSNDLSTSLKQPCVIVGSTEDASGKLSYGGSIAKDRFRPLRFEKVWDAKLPIECHAMNGNCVLIPKSVANIVGCIDPTFEHAMGDIDYALRARAAGMRVFVAPGFVGRCESNSTANTHRDINLPFIKRWKILLGPKGLPVASWYRFTRRHGGLLWPLHFIWPYMKQVFR